jgi:2-polyprenyl-3-methyl-5-hydroxy-6-metoxy-1,4-benzoquinol methylase
MQNYERVKSDPVSAQLYTSRKPRKHQFEMQMVTEAFQMLPVTQVKTVLDAPCGVGRISLWLAQKGCEVTAIDLGEAATRITENLLAEHHKPGNVECRDIMNMGFSEGQFDASICFRLLHHFSETRDQQALVDELCRVSSGYVVISYFSKYSVTSIRRKVRRFFTGKPIKQNPLSLNHLKGLFGRNDFQLLGTVRRSGFLHSLQLAVFESRH